VCAEGICAISCKLAQACHISALCHLDGSVAEDEAHTALVHRLDGVQLFEGKVACNTAIAQVQDEAC
jgi:hypothetical protein